MKMSHKFLVLSLLTLALSGCSSCPKKACTAATPEPVPPAQVMEKVAAPVVQEAAPVVRQATPKKIPAAVLK